LRGQKEPRGAGPADRSDGRGEVRNSKRERPHVRMILRRQVEGTGRQGRLGQRKDPGRALDAQGKCTVAANKALEGATLKEGG